MAGRPESTAKGDIREPRRFEEETCLSRRQARRFVVHLWAIIGSMPPTAAVLAEDAVWLPLRDAFAFLFLLFTGLRRFEFCRAVCGEVDIAEARLWVVGKGRIRDYVPMGQQAVDLLVRWLDVKGLRGESTSAQAPLFCATGSSKGTFLSFSALRLRWKAALEAAGLPTTFGIHSTRHAAGLIVLSETNSLEKVSRFLRHQNLATTEKFYRHIDAEELRGDLANVEIWNAPPAGADEGE